MTYPRITMATASVYIVYVVTSERQYTSTNRIAFEAKKEYCITCWYSEKSAKMSKRVTPKRQIKKNAAFVNHDDAEKNEEFNNFMNRVGEVNNIVRDMASGDKKKAEAAKALADQYLGGKVILDEDVKMTVKSDRTVINQKAFNAVDKKDAGEMDASAWMASVSKDAEQRAHDRKIRREKAETLKMQATKAFRRGEYDRALSYYNKAIEQVKDNPMLYCDRALTNIKLGKFDKVGDDCYWALRINEHSFKARLYQAKAYKELEQLDKLEQSKTELAEKFPQHEDLVKYFLNKREGYYEGGDGEEDVMIKY